MKKLGIIFVLYNATPWIRACLDSLRKQTSDDFAIYAVDNNSSDETFKIVSEEYPEVHLIKSDTNLGFAGGNNIATKKALEDGVEYIVLLNQDTVVQENYVEAGLKVIEREGVGLASPKMLYKENGTIWWAGSKLYRGMELFLRPQFQIAEHIDKKAEDKGQFDKEFETDYIPGTSMFIKKEVIEKVGLLDSKNFFMYSEDLDYSLRVKKAGYKLLHFATTTVYHDTPFSKKERPSMKRIWFKYSNYFKGVMKIVNMHFTLTEKIVWYAKLPITLPLTFIYEVL